MPNTVYANTDSSLVASGGGQTGLAVGAGSTSQVNSGTSIPCKVAYVTALATSAVHIGINSSTNVSLGALVPTVPAVSEGPVGPMEIAIDDAAKLWFYAGAVASVYISYRY